MKLVQLLAKQSVAKYLILALCFLATTGFADTKLYQVEMVIFSQINSQSYQSESWPDVSLKQPNSNSYQALQSAMTAPPVAFDYLPNSNFVMNKEAARLSRQGAYTILAHVAWLQPISTSSRKPVQILTGQTYDSDGNPIALSPMITTDTSTDIYTVEGYVRTVKRRFFDMNVNLWLSLPASDLPSGATDNNLKTFHLIQNLRLRENEIHYIDNPLFGILVKIVPYSSAH